MIRIFFIAIGVVLGQSCTSQTTEVSCDGTGGCKWTNGTAYCRGIPGSCSGTSTCAGLESSVCNSNTGCSYVTASPGGCVGTASCSAQTTEGGCDELDGCLWNESTADSCVGAPSTCSGTSEASCQLDGCTYTTEAKATLPACTPSDGYSPIRCENAINQASCGLLTSSSGCEWKEPTPAHCTLQVEDDWTCDTFNQFGSEGGVYCSLVPGCTYSGNVGTCEGGPISKTCAEFSDEDCDTVGCESVEVGECLPEPCERYDEERCSETAGCIYSSEGNTCSGTPSSAACGTIIDSKTCWETNGCQYKSEEECIVPEECDRMGGEACTAAGCTRTEVTGDDGHTTETCSGVPNVTEATCRGANGNDCYSLGCSSLGIYQCVGDVEVETCEVWGYGGSTCTTLGCNSVGVVGGSCSGTIDRGKAATATNEESCTTLGEAFEWYDGDEGSCECTNRSCSSSKQCSEFTASGNEICYDLGCTWTPGVAQGCAGTPTNTGTDCASLTSDGESICTGNQCNWVTEGEKTCTGKVTGMCSDQTEATCETIGGCTYNLPTTESCTGTNSGFCSGGTSSSCKSVSGCTWTAGCLSLISKIDCDGNNVCTWNQPGTCASTADTSGTSSVYASLWVLLLLLVLLL